MCMRVEFHQQKNGLSSLTAFSMNLRLASRNSSSTVSIRLIVSGPVSSIFCVPSGIGPAVQHAARPELLLELRDPSGSPGFSGSSSAFRW